MSTIIIIDNQPVEVSDKAASEIMTLRAANTTLQARVTACLDDQNAAQKVADLMVDEFKRILALVAEDTEIADLCNRAMQNTYQHVPVIMQRDKAVYKCAQLIAENDALKQRILDDNKSYGCELRDPSGTIWEHTTKLQKENTALIKRMRGLAMLWLSQQMAYPITTEGMYAAAVVRCCANELIAALNAAKEGKR